MNFHGKLFQKKRDCFRIHHEESLANKMFNKHLNELIPPEKNSIVIVCIGTDRSTGDSLGPLVGTNLRDKLPSNISLYGTLESPVHAVNLQHHLDIIQEKHRHSFVIGIDACLGKTASIGVITVGDGPVKPGAGVNKQLPPVGHMHITGIVNVSGFMEHLVLQNTRLHLVMSMANFIAESLSDVFSQRKVKMTVS